MLHFSLFDPDRVETYTVQVLIETYTVQALFFKI